MINTEIPKWKNVDLAIRRQIVEKRWEPGSRLPTYDALEEQFSVSRITLQQVMRQLKQDGFVSSLERQGLFVSAFPPHLTRVGIAVPRDEHENRFWMEYVQTARVVADAMGKELVVYRQFEKSKETAEQLLKDIQDHLLCGVIFLFDVSPSALGYSAYTAPGIPKSVPTLVEGAQQMQLRAFHDPDVVIRALDYLESEGCRRIAVFHNNGDSDMTRTYEKEVARRGLYAPEEWSFRISLTCRDVAGQIARLLLGYPKEERPDGIFISDDNYTIPVVRGVASTRICLPEELKIVSHYNWSVTPPDPLPVKYIGFDLRETVREIFASFQEYQETGVLRPRLDVEALFENELKNPIAKA